MSDKKYYKTEKGINSLHKNIKYSLVKSKEEFDEASEYLLGKKYVSFAAEKRRADRFTFSLRNLVYTHERAIEIFKNLSMDICRSHGIEFESYQELKNLLFDTGIKGNIYKIEIIEIEDKNEYYFVLTYIVDDVMYVDEVWLYHRKNNKYKLTVSKNMLLPFAQEMISQYTWTGKWFNKKQFKQYKKEILMGLSI